MTKMATTPIYGKKHSKIFFSGTGRPSSRNLVCSIGTPAHHDPGVTLTYFTARSNLVTLAFLWENVKTVDFSETIAACDLEVGRCRELIEFMKVYEY